MYNSCLVDTFAPQDTVCAALLGPHDAIWEEHKTVSANDLLSMLKVPCDVERLSDKLEDQYQSDKKEVEW